jgi:hypothetical protein
MFGGTFMAEPDSNGHYCIDRDPTHFRKILNFFRTGQIVMSNESDREKAMEMLLEAQYYSIEPMIQKVRIPIQFLWRKIALSITQISSIFTVTYLPKLP